MVEKSRKYYAVFGKPILHSLSPQLYNALFREERINACYTRIHASTGKAVCEIIKALGLSGANITTPFKEEVIPCMDRLSPGASEISAVNTVINDNGKLTGHNTDPDGITGSLMEAGVDPSGRRCLVMGAGGAGKAAAKGLMDAGAEVLLANRNPARALEFAAKTGCRCAGLDKAAEKLKEFEIIVLTLPPGVFPFDPEQVSSDVVIVDANYRSPAGRGESHNFSGRIISGDRWLLHQAVGAYRLYTGKEADISVMEKGFNEKLDPDNLTIKTITRQSVPELIDHAVDMLVDGRNIDHKLIKEIIDEEKNKAFRG